MNQIAPAMGAAASTGSMQGDSGMSEDKPIGGAPVVFIKELSERDRAFMLNHFLALSAEDRFLRFGVAMPDESVAGYVKDIDFTQDKTFGVYKSTCNMVGVGHLVFFPPEKLSAPSCGKEAGRVAEFGVSVAASMRRLKIGAKLFDRAAIHCCNNGVDVMYIHCLASNRPMLYIAKKAGMEINYDRGEVDGYLRLSGPNPAISFQETVEEGAAIIDCRLKRRFRRTTDWCRNRPKPKDF